MLTDEYYRRLFAEPLEIDTPEKAERFIEALEKAKTIAEEKGGENIKGRNIEKCTFDNWRDWFISKGNGGAKISDSSNKT